MNGSAYFVPFYAWEFGGPATEHRLRFATPQGAWRLRRIRFADPRAVVYGRELVVESLTLGRRTPIAHVAPRENDAPLRLSDLDRIRFLSPVEIGETCELTLRVRRPDEIPAEWALKRIAMIATFDEQPARKPPARGAVLGFFPLGNE